jgi:uncharacterized repeat protein (TIGR04042 family)
MPEMTFTVRWPDGKVEDCYSPSLVMHDHLEAGTSYPLDLFVAKSSAALDLASARVRAKYGFECTSAMQQKSEIVAAASTFPPTAIVEVVAMHPPLEA